MTVQVDHEALERRFRSLASAWREAVGPSSSVSHMAMHPAYQQIIGMGPEAVPLLLKELQREPNHWFWALAAITGENPVSEAHKGMVPRMAEDWVRWGRERGLI